MHARLYTLHGAIVSVHFKLDAIGGHVQCAPVYGSGACQVQAYHVHCVGLVSACARMHQRVMLGKIKRVARARGEGRGGGFIRCIDDVVFVELCTEE